MLRLSKDYDNRGLSLVELIVVIAIIVVMIGAAGFGLSLLIGTEARQAVYKMEAQLNDVKTGTLTKGGEELVIRYIEVPDKKTNATAYEAFAQNGVELSGYYADKSIYTIKMDNKLDKTNIGTYSSGDREYDYIGSSKVTIDVYCNGSDIPTPLGTEKAVRIKFNRRTGGLEEVEIGNNDPSDYAYTFSGTPSGDLDMIEFSAGLHKYTMKFKTLTGKYMIE